MEPDIIVEVREDEQRGRHVFFVKHPDPGWAERTLSLTELGIHFTSLKRPFTSRFQFASGTT